MILIFFNQGSELKTMRKSTYLYKCFAFQFVHLRPRKFGLACYSFNHVHLYLFIFCFFNHISCLPIFYFRECQIYISRLKYQQFHQVSYVLLNCNLYTIIMLVLSLYNIFNLYYHKKYHVSHYVTILKNVYNKKQYKNMKPLKQNV